jgi:hypothetical protein
MANLNINQLNGGTVQTTVTGAELFEAYNASGVNVPMSLDTILVPITVLPSGDSTGTTDFNNIQAALNTLAGDSSGNLRKLVLQGQYTTNAKLVVPLSAASNNQQGSLQIIGYGQTAITFTGSNIGCLEFQTATGSSCHGISIENIAIISQSQQGPSNTASFGIGFRSSTGTTNGTIFQIYIDRVYIQGFYRSIANTQTSGQYAVWGMKISRCIFGVCSGAALWLASPTSIGQPNINIDHVYATEYVGGTEPLFVIDACDSLWLDSVETNNLTNRSLYKITSSLFTLNRFKLETSTYSSNANPVLSFANSSGSINGFLFSNPALTATNLLLIDAAVGETNSKICINDLTIAGSTGAGTLTCVEGGGVGKYLFNVSPNVTTLGSGPIVVRLTNSGSSVISNLVNFAAPPGGNVSDDNVQASITTFNPLTNPSVNIWNTPLTGNITVNLAAASGSVVADNCWEGAPFSFVRTANATGASTFTISAAIPATKTLAAGQQATYQYRRSFGGFIEISNATLP